MTHLLEKEVDIGTLIHVVRGRAAIQDHLDRVALSAPATAASKQTGNA
jgi:hypothetical protein